MYIWKIWTQILVTALKFVNNNNNNKINNTISVINNNNNNRNIIINNLKKNILIYEFYPLSFPYYI